MENYEEIFEEIKKRYPIGTKFYPAHIGNKKTICEVFDYNSLRIIKDGCHHGDIDLYDRDLRNCNSYFGCLYHKARNKWAEIVHHVKPIVNNNYEIY